MVPRRLALLLVAAAIAFAPVALDACQVMCALPPAHAVAEAHACHGMAMSHRAADGPAMQGLPHKCAHGDDLPTAAGAMVQGANAAPAVIPVVCFDLTPSRAGKVHADNAPNTSPPRTASIGQLRV